MAFRSIFSSRSAVTRVEEISEGFSFQESTRDLAAQIEKGFLKSDRQSRIGVFELLQRFFERKVKRQMGMSDREFRTLLGRSDKIKAIVEDDELVLLLAGRLKSSRPRWDIESLNRIVSKIEDWNP